MNALPTAPSTAPASIRPSGTFLLVVAATVAGVWWSVTNPDVGNGTAVFLLVLAGWILSLIFHEFAHAVVAWRGGDTSIPSKGYLTLDPRRYADPLTSIAIPLFILIAGGIGLPGGAVWINRSALRSRAIASLVSLAGPATNLIFAAACLLPLSMGVIDPDSQPVLAAGLGFLGFLQVFAFVLNMLPVPGLDGFGAIEPFLPRSVLVAIAPLRSFAIIGLILVLFAVEPVRSALFDLIEAVMAVFGADQTVSGDDLRAAGVDTDLPARELPLRSVGWELFRFWDRG
ncbi:MAG: site-2 protease family protein [Actinomycetota bacterium]